ncbi:TIGR02300 family protein [Bosea sp. TND4EK4]|nr:TIGR02300 family protein [Bosea sp. TND4EK4]
MMVEGSDAVAKPELGTKRVCPVTGRKFYDLNKDPVVSPYTGQSYPLSMFEPQAKAAAVAAPKATEEEDEVEVADEAVELVSLEDADAEATEKEAVVTSEDDIEVEDEIDAEDDDTFLEEDEEGDDDVSDLIDGEIEGDEDN